MRNLMISSLAMVGWMATAVTAQAASRPLNLVTNAPLARANFLHPNNTESQPLFNASGGSAAGRGLISTGSSEEFGIMLDNDFLQATWTVPARFRVDAEIVSAAGANHGYHFAGTKNLIYLVGDQDNDFDTDNSATMLFSKTLLAFGYRGNSTEALFEFVFTQTQPTAAEITAYGLSSNWNPLFPVGSQIGVIATIDGSSGFDASEVSPFDNDFTGGNASDFVQAFSTDISTSAAVPEPGTGALLGLGLAGLGLLAWRRYRQGSRG